MQSSDITKQQLMKNGWELVQNIELEPTRGATVIIGVFEEGMCEPIFRLVTLPDPFDDLTAELIRQEGNGEYTLAYSLQNYSKYHTCQVKIWEKCV